MHEKQRNPKQTRRNSKNIKLLIEKKHLYWADESSDITEYFITQNFFQLPLG